MVLDMCLSKYMEGRLFNSQAFSNRAFDAHATENLIMFDYERNVCDICHV